MPVAYIGKVRTTLVQNPANLSDIFLYTTAAFHTEPSLGMSLAGATFTVARAIIAEKMSIPLPEGTIVGCRAAIRRGKILLVLYII